MEDKNVKLIVSQGVEVEVNLDTLPEGSYVCVMNNEALDSIAVRGAVYAVACISAAAWLTIFIVSKLV